MSSRFIMPFANVGSGIKPSSGAKLLFFKTDGVTPKDTFSDQLSTPTPNTNPVISDSNGVFGNIYIDGDYKVTLKDKNDSLKFSLAEVSEVSTGNFDTNVDADATIIKKFDTVQEFKDYDFEFPNGKTIRLLDRGADFTKISGQSGDDTDIIPSTSVNQSVQLPEVSTVSIRNLGGIGDDGVTDDTAAVQKAFELMQLVHGEVDLLDRMWRYTTPIVISEPITVKGTVNGVQNTNDTKGAILLKDGNFTGIEITSASHPTLRDFALKGHTGNGGTGLKITSGGRFKLHRFSSTTHNLSNIEYNDGNIGSWLDVRALGSITGSGLWVNGAVTPDTNAVDFDIDARDNATNGVFLDNCWNARGYFKTQSNGTGIKINNVRQSDFAVYSESNSVIDIEMTNHVNLEGNMFKFLFYGSITDNQVNPTSNMIFRALENADTRAIFDNMVAKRFELPVLASATGNMTLEHLSNAKHNMFFDKTGAKQTLVVKNVASLADPVNDIAVQPVSMRLEGGNIENKRVIFTAADTTPDVNMGQFFLANAAGAITITDFIGGGEGVTITVVFNTAFTTLQHTAFTSQTGLTLKTGANTLYAKGEVRQFFRNGSNWWLEL